MTPTWCRAYTTCSHSSCRNWIWNDKIQPGTRCRRCGTWWPNVTKATGKGKGQGHGATPQTSPGSMAPPAPDHRTRLACIPPADQTASTMVDHRYRPKKLNGWCLPADLRTHLKTWVQGAVQYRDNGQAKQCPICHVPAAPKHILWLCKWHHGQGHKPMPPDWAERITHHDEEPLWNAGWIPLEPQEQLQVEHPYQGHGAWQDLQALAPHQHQGWAFTLDATPSTYDQRSQVWSVGYVCIP